MASAVASPAADRTAGAGKVRPAKLFIGGLTRNTTTRHLRDHFSRYGRVLDCVAMRQPDGRSRGFGYVTLDSPAAADRCLAEQQVVDGRVVDMKKAVPGPASVPSGDFGWIGGCSPSHHSVGGVVPFMPPGSWDMFGYCAGMGYPTSPYSTPMLNSWGIGSPKSNDEVLDCLDLLRYGTSQPSPSTASTRSVRTCSGVLSNGSFNSPACTPAATPTSRTGSAGLSASALEFVPRDTGSAEAAAQQPEQSSATPRKIEFTLKPVRQARSALSEITNLLAGGDAPLPVQGGSVVGRGAPRAQSRRENQTVAFTVYEDGEAADDPQGNAGKEQRREIGDRHSAGGSLAGDEDSADDSQEDSGCLALPGPLRLPGAPLPAAGASPAAFLCSLPPGLPPPRHMELGLLSTALAPGAASAAVTAVPHTWTPTAAAAAAAWAAGGGRD